MTTDTSKITGREPALSPSYQGKGGTRKLSLRRLGTMLNVLPPEAISLAAAEEMLRSDHFYVRYNAAKKLGQRADRDARLIMQKVLTDGETPSRASIARHLYGFSWFSAEPLIKQALADTDSRVREAAIYALCDMRDLKAYELMTQVLENEESNVQEAATYGLRECHDPEAVPVLATVLRSKDIEVRIKALEALGANDTPQAIPFVRNAINDSEPDVKYAATLSLLELAGESWLQELSGVIGRTDGVTREQILRAFFHATNYLKIDVGQSKAADTMIDALEVALFDELPAVRRAAVWPVAWMKHERTGGILRRAYNLEEDSDVKAHIVRISVDLMADVGKSILEDALKSKDETVRVMAENVRESYEISKKDVAAWAD